VILVTGGIFDQPMIVGVVAVVGWCQAIVVDARIYSPPTGNPHRGRRAARAAP
jgi:hypothetical protein